MMNLLILCSEPVFSQAAFLPSLFESTEVSFEPGPAGR